MSFLGIKVRIMTKLQIKGKYLELEKYKGQRKLGEGIFFYLKWYMRMCVVFGCN